MASMAMKLMGRMRPRGMSTSRLQQQTKRFAGDLVQQKEQTLKPDDAKVPQQKQDEKDDEKARKMEQKKKEELRLKHFFEDEERRRSLVTHHEEFFEHNIKEKTLENFLIAIDIFKTKRRQQMYIDFIYASLLKMDEYKANKSLDAYKKILSVFPVGPYVVQNKWQMSNMHFPRQQNCALAVLEQMERNFVCPDEDIVRQCIALFGDWTHVVRKAKRQLYWLPKFRNANRYPLPSPDKLEDPLELGMAAIKRMCTVDATTEIHVKLTCELPGDQEDTWIVWGQSEGQRVLLNTLDCKQVPLYVEGPYLVWLRGKCVEYFVLKTDKLPDYDLKMKQLKDFDEFDVSKLSNKFLNQKNEKKTLSVHELENGTILGLACTGTSTKSSCITWINILQDYNKKLKDFAVIFRVKDKSRDVESATENKTASD